MSASPPSLFELASQHFDRVAPFYARAPQAEALVRDLPEGDRPLDESDLKAIVEFNACPFSNRGALEGQTAKLSDPRCLVVLTGQQPGLLLGPLYTPIKALHAIRLANWLEEKTGRPAVPVFWIGADDHDFEEIRSVTWPTADGARAEFQLQLPSSCEGHSVGPMPLASEEVARLLAQVESTLPQTEHRAWACDLIRDAAGESKTIGGLFRHLILRLFQSHGLIAIDLWTAPIQRLLPQILRPEIEHPGAITERVLAASRRLEEAGLSPQVHRRAGDLNLFQYVEEVRCRVAHENGKFVTLHPASGETVREQTAEEILRDLEEHPEHFSPNVVTKPLVRDMALQPAAYIGGPGEVAYYAQFRDVYEAAQVRMPAIVPRARATLLNGPAKRGLGKLGLDAEAWLDMTPEARADHVARLGAGGAALAHVESHRERLEGEVKCLEETVAEFDAGLRKSVERLASSLVRGLEKIQDQVSRSAQTRDKQIAEASRRVSDALQPGGAPQERVDNLLLPHLALHGPWLLERIHDAIDVENPSHRVVDLTGGP